ncbi:MAG: hypothetical protein IJ339_01210 [Oscillospiraceae bacterium]|nr:hypothetical protein [Oscillospiraceae bacterium]MBQ7815961.1 hypothetical protein [Oscillospiraceae bacterium]
MAGKDNLKVPSSEEARENGAKGGKKSAEKRREKKMLQDALEKLLKCKASADNVASLNENMAKLGIDTSNFNMAQLMALAQIINAVKGEKGAYELIRDSIGEKPVEEHKIAADTNFKVEITGFDD